MRARSGRPRSLWRSTPRRRSSLPDASLRRASMTTLQRAHQLAGSRCAGLQGCAASRARPAADPVPVIRSWSRRSGCPTMRRRCSRPRRGATPLGYSARVLAARSRSSRVLRCPLALRRRLQRGFRCYAGRRASSIRGRAQPVRLRRSSSAKTRTRPRWIEIAPGPRRSGTWDTRHRSPAQPAELRRLAEAPGGAAPTGSAA